LSTSLRAKAIVDAVTYYDCPEILAKVSRGLGEAMAGIDIRKLREEERLAQRGW
jgi:pyridoxal 5'-phosphate synthase pdxS subunit